MNGVLERQIEGLLDIKLRTKLEDGFIAAGANVRMMVLSGQKRDYGCRIRLKK